MNRAERRRAPRQAPERSTVLTYGQPEFAIVSDPGCEMEEHGDMVLSIMFASGGAADAGMPDVGDLVLAGDHVQWSCGCWFWIEDV